MIRNGRKAAATGTGGSLLLRRLVYFYSALDTYLTDALVVLKTIIYSSLEESH